MGELKKFTSRDSFCQGMAKHISEVTESEICPTTISENLLLLELGREPKDKLIGEYIKKHQTCY